MKKRTIFTFLIALLLVAVLALPATAAVEQTVPASVTITEHISITITDSGTAGVNFGSLEPGAINAPDTDSNDTTPTITVNVE